MPRRKKLNPKRDEGAIGFFRGQGDRRPRSAMHRSVQVLNQFITKWHKLIRSADVIVAETA
jgi:hypothetical protein